MLAEKYAKLNSNTYWVYSRDIFLNENSVSHKETDLLYSHCVFWVTTPCCAVTGLLTFGGGGAPDIIRVKDEDTFLQTLGTHTANYSMMSNPEERNMNMKMERVLPARTSVPT